MPSPLLVSSAVSLPSALLLTWPPGDSGNASNDGALSLLLLLLATNVPWLLLPRLPLLLLAWIASLLLRSLLLSALAASGSSIVCSSCCGRGCVWPRLT
jgi:hypothetical protein